MLSSGILQGRWRRVSTHPPPRSLHLGISYHPAPCTANVAAADVSIADSFRVALVFPALLARRIHAFAPHFSELQPLLVFLRCVSGSNGESLQERGRMVCRTKRGYHHEWLRVRVRSGEVRGKIRF